MELAKMPQHLCCFLMLGWLARTEPQCLDGMCGVPEPGSQNPESKPLDEESTEMRVELLQRDLKLSSKQRKSENAAATVTVSPWACSGSTAYQSTTANDNSWTKVKELNLATGKYDEIYNIPLDKFTTVSGCPSSGTTCKIRSMNGCAMHRKKGTQENTLYCAMQIYDKGCFLVAMDQNGAIGFVKKLPGFRYAATFFNDDYYVSGDEGLSIVKNVPGLPKYENWHGLNGMQEAGLVDLTMNGETKDRHQLGADWVVWEKVKDEEQYLMTLKDHELLLIHLLKEGEETSSGDVIVMETNVVTGPGDKRVWGAAWNFNGAIYFSADDGSALYRFDTADFDTKKATFTNMTSTPKIDWNDGFTCGTSLNPPIIKSDCEHDFYQVVTTHSNPGESQPEVKVDSVTTIRALDPTTGKYTKLFDVDRKQFPNMASLNACAVHPTDEKLYCMMKEINNDQQSIVNVGNNGIGLNTQHTETADLCFAAVFDKSSNYWYWCGDTNLYKASGLDKKKPVWSKNDNGFKDNSNIEVFKDDYTDDKVGADFVVWEEEGREYLISIVKSKDSDVSVIEVTDSSNPSKPKILKSSGLPKSQSEPVTWGSAWTGPKLGNYAGKHFFTPDVKATEEKKGLYLLKSLDLENSEAHFEEQGLAEPATWHDGFSCLNKKVVNVDTR